MKSFLVLFVAMLAIIILGLFIFSQSTSRAALPSSPTSQASSANNQDALAYAQVAERLVPSETPAQQPQNVQVAQSMVQSDSSTTTTTQPMQVKDTYLVTLKTNQGDITLELYGKQVPNTVDNFVKLSQAGFYNNVKFHRVIKGFMIQGGDPNTKDDNAKDTWGMGGPGYRFADEFAKGLSNVAGTISMANAGPNTNGSQFFINTNNNTFLDGKHSVFGKVVKGLDVVQKIENSKTDAADRPVEPVIILSVSVE